MKINSTLDIQSVQEFPTEWSDASMAIDFTRQIAMSNGIVRNLDEILTCTRSTSKYVPKSGGTLVYFGPNELPVTDKGILIEESRTNLIPYSENFSTWTQTYSPAVTDNYTTAPDGNNTACLVEDSSASAYSGIYKSLTVPDDTSSYCVSLFVKKDNDETRFPELQVHITGGTTSVIDIVQFNTKTGATATRLGAPSNIKCEDYGDFWRLSFVSTNNATGNTSLQVRIYPAIGVSGGFGGATTSAVGAIVCWGAQLEQGSFPTSYIATSGAAVTRAADVVQFSDLSWWTTEGTFFTEFNSGMGWNDSRFVFMGDQFSNSFIYTNYGTNDAYAYDGSTSFSYGSLLNFTDYKIAVTQTNSGAHSSINGSVASTSTVVLRNDVSLALGYNKQAVNGFLCSYLKRFVFFPIVKTDAELQALTA